MMARNLILIMTSVTRWQGYFQYLAIYNNENLSNSISIYLK